MTTIKVIVTAESGLHARPANLFVKTATKFASSIRVSKGDKEVDGKRLLALLTLGAKKGDSICIHADGIDEKEAIKKLKALFDTNFKE